MMTTGFHQNGDHYHDSVLVLFGYLQLIMTLLQTLWPRALQHSESLFVGHGVSGTVALNNAQTSLFCPTCTSS